MTKGKENFSTETRPNFVIRKCVLQSSVLYKTKRKMSRKLLILLHEALDFHIEHPITSVDLEPNKDVLLH